MLMHLLGKETFHACARMPYRGGLYKIEGKSDEAGRKPRWVKRARSMQKYISSLRGPTIQTVGCLDGFKVVRTQHRGHI